MPAWVLRYLPALLAVVAVVFALFAIYKRGERAEKQRTELVATKQRAAAAEAQARDLTVRQLKADETIKAYRASTEKVRTITKETIREVHVRIPADACPLPEPWRVLHDAAASGQASDPTTTPGTDGGPVAAQDAAATVIENYGSYHELAERHRSLQRYVKEQLQ